MTIRLDVSIKSNISPMVPAMASPSDGMLKFFMIIPRHISSAPETGGSDMAKMKHMSQSIINQPTLMERP